MTWCIVAAWAAAGIVPMWADWLIGQRTIPYRPVSTTLLSALAGPLVLLLIVGTWHG